MSPLLLVTALLGAPERLVVGLRGGDLWSTRQAARVREVTRAAGGFEVRRLSFALVVDVPDSEAAVRALAARPDVAWIERDSFFPVSLRAVPDDPRYPEQWHLHAVADPAIAPELQMSLEVAWEESRGRLPDGAAVRVAILDDGFDLGHPDLAPAAAGGFDVSADDGVYDDDPSWQSGDWHGTQTAGVAAARGFDGVGVAGVCPECELLLVRLIGGGGPEQLFTSGSAAAAALEWAVDAGADVINNSWGPPDGDPSQPDHRMTLWPRQEPGRDAGVLPRVLSEALERAVTQGRGGRGAVITWSAGNGNELVTYDRFAADPRVAAIGSVDASGRRAPYSDYGPPLFLVTPSSGDRGAPKIVTTDVRGASGVDPGDWSAGFGGTSASAPMAAGIAALVIARYPTLTAAQVREAMALGAVVIDAEHGEWNDGRSPFYGFGRADAAGALAAAALYGDDCTFGLELCGNGKDDDCNGVTDDASQCSLCIPTQSLELCDGVDNDCDGCNNEDFACVASERPDCAPCSDSSQCTLTSRCSGTPDFPGEWCFRICDAGTPCPEGFACNGLVCLLAVSPETPDCRAYLAMPCVPPESCNGLDDDGDGATDDVDPRSPDAESAATLCDGPGVCAGREARCVQGRWGCVDPVAYEPVEGSPADGLDNDCDGTVDEAAGCTCGAAGASPLLLLSLLALTARHRRSTPRSLRLLKSPPPCAIRAALDEGTSPCPASSSNPRALPTIPTRPI